MRKPAFELAVEYFLGIDRLNMAGAVNTVNKGYSAVSSDDIMEYEPRLKGYICKNAVRLAKDKRSLSIMKGEFFVDTVEEVRPVRHPAQPVYDFEVPNNQNFVGGAGGVLCHNSEASQFFVAMHAGIAPRGAASTIHSVSVTQIPQRVIEPPMSVQPVNLLSLDTIIGCARTQDIKTRRERRYVSEIATVGDVLLDVTRESRYIDINHIWKYDWREGALAPVLGAETKKYYSKMADRAGMSLESFVDEIRLRALLLHYFDIKNMVGLEQLQAEISRFYAPSTKEGEASKERAELIRDAKRTVPQKIQRQIESFRFY